MGRAGRWGLTALVVLVVVAAGVAGSIYVGSERELDRVYPVPSTALSLPTDPASLGEGRRLAVVHGCLKGCHGREGEGGVMFDDPKIARVVAPNLPAAAQKYDASALAAIIRNGVRPDGRSVLVMPSEAFVALDDGDLAKTIAFLKSMPPSTPPQVAMAYGPLGRLGLATGRFKTAAHLIAETVPPPEVAADTDNRGRYRARTVCGGCHAPALNGAETPSFTSPDLALVVGYTQLSFETLMRTGMAPGNRVVGMMTVAARDHLSSLTDAEIGALYVYLHGLAEARAMRAQAARAR